jgi:hypothetical protein
MSTRLLDCLCLCEYSRTSLGPMVPMSANMFDSSNIGTKLSHHLNTRLGYGLGPLLFSPLSEIPQIGRNIPYATTFFVYTLVSIPLALVRNAPAFGYVSSEIYLVFWTIPKVAGRIGMDRHQPKWVDRCGE